MSLESWSFSDKDLTLKWESPRKAAFDMRPFMQNEYKLDREDITLEETTTTYHMYTPSPRTEDDPSLQSNHSFHHPGVQRKVTGNYSTLLIHFRMTRYVRTVTQL